MWLEIPWTKYKHFTQGTSLVWTFHIESVQSNFNQPKCPVAVQAFFCLCEYDREGAERSSSLLKSGWRATLQFWSLALLLSVVGSRVSSLIVLEFCLRAVSAWASAGLVSSQTLSMVLVHQLAARGPNLARLLYLARQIYLNISFKWGEKKRFWIIYPLPQKTSMAFRNLSLYLKNINKIQ